VAISHTPSDVDALCRLAAGRRMPLREMLRALHRAFINAEAKKGN
jgi:hypothetical protein